MDACNHPGAPRRRWESRVKRFMQLQENDLKPRKSYEIGDGFAAALRNRLRESLGNRNLFSEKVEQMNKGYCDVIKTTHPEEKIAGCDSSEDEEEVAHKIDGLTLDV